MRAQELQILKAVLNQDKGVCEQAAKMKDQEAAKKKILAIRKIVNGANNLVFAQYAHRPVRVLKLKYATQEFV